MNELSEKAKKTKNDDVTLSQFILRWTAGTVLGWCIIAGVWLLDNVDADTAEVIIKILSMPLIGLAVLALNQLTEQNWQKAIAAVVGLFAVLIVIAVVSILLQIDYLFIALFLSLITGVPMLLTQSHLLRNWLHLPVSRWFTLSLVAWFVGWFALFIAGEEDLLVTLNMNIAPKLETALGFVIVFIPMIAIQTVLLTRHVRQAWLWLLTGIMGMALFALSPDTADSDSWQLLLACLLYAILSGTIVFYLATTRRKIPPINAKSDAILA